MNMKQETCLINDSEEDPNENIVPHIYHQDSVSQLSDNSSSWNAMLADNNLLQVKTELPTEESETDSTITRTLTEKPNFARRKLKYKTMEHKTNDNESWISSKRIKLENDSFIGKSKLEAAGGSSNFSKSFSTEEMLQDFHFYNHVKKETLAKDELQDKSNQFYTNYSKNLSTNFKEAQNLNYLYKIDYANKQLKLQAIKDYKLNLLKKEHQTIKNIELLQAIIKNYYHIRVPGLEKFNKLRNQHLNDLRDEIKKSLTGRFEFIEHSDLWNLMQSSSSANENENETAKQQVKK